MIMVMEEDREFGKKLDEIEESKVDTRVSSDASGDSNEEAGRNLEVLDEARVSSGEFGSRFRESEGEAKVLESERSQEVRVTDSSEGGTSVDEEGGASGLAEMKAENFDDERMSAESDQLDGLNEKFEGGSAAIVVRNEGVDDAASRVDLLSEFDDYVANDRIGGATSRALSYGFEVGDMVWGKVKSHPWWPGHIFNEAFATTSVRRTRREGHVLVAFFGDSSYGWFDPAELIPFDPYFAEKSQQTNSRTFVKAVEEAMDEASRRCGLGLACKCRNPFNFRPTKVQGYFVVDVPDYEPGAVYSVKQIRKARNRFRPSEILSFVKRLAAAPHDNNEKSIEFFKNKATVFCFRKAAFEEFDETYAQAFGVQPARHLNDSTSVHSQPVKEPPRAPLSGPLVIAEALGGEKNSKKPMKVKDHSKKDRYLFKRRDEPNDLRSLQFNQGQASPPVQPAFTEGSSVFLAGDYVLQKRAPAPQLEIKDEQNIVVGKNDAGSIGDLSEKHKALDRPSVGDLSADVKPFSDKEAVDYRLPSFQQQSDSMRTLKHDESENFQKSSFVKAEGGEGSVQIQDSQTGGHLLSVDAKQSVAIMADGAVKKKKVIKRHLGEQGSENAEFEEKKKKKRKFGIETNSEHLKKRLALAKGGILAGKSNQAGLNSKENIAVMQQKKDIGPVNASPVGTENLGLELPQLLSDLHALALDPFHGNERSCPAIIRHFFLRFRSLVYQKSLVLSSQSESEPVEAHVTKPPSSGTSGGYSDEGIRSQILPKPMRPLVRPDDPTKVGRKRLPSDRQEEIAAKRLKKINQLKSLAAEKKAGQRSVELPQGEGKDHPSVVPTSKPLRKPDSVKKVGPPVKALEPTMLVMKFPPDTSLPSVAELKARFGRFGSLDQSGTRVYWKSSTCRVVFNHKVDAQAACRYANSNSSLFGNVNVRYSCRPVETPAAAEVSEPDKTRGDDAMNETLRVKDHVVERPTSVLKQKHLQQTVQLKSCLKKPTNDEAAQVTGGNGSRATPRVKFILGGEETGRGEQLGEKAGSGRNFSNNASFADAGPPVGMEFNSKNFQKAIPPSPLPILPLPQFAKAPVNNLHHSEVVARNSLNFNTQTAPPPSMPSVDISQQMLSLLTRCNDVVTNVTGLLGYVPYHPL